MATRIFVILSSLTLTYATLGVDVSDYIDAFLCMRESGFQFAIISGYLSTGQVDPNAIKNINNARNAGFVNVDVYAYPCVLCGNPSAQANYLVSTLGNSNYGRIWLAVEDSQWSSSQSSNQSFITNFINTLQGRSKSAGIYTSYNNWQSIVGLTWSGVSSLPLWYYQPDNNPSFSNFQAFGGWSNPAIKQYALDKKICGKDADLNYS